MKSLLHRLSSRKHDINVVIIGIGAMGKGLVYQCKITPGIKCIGVADLNIARCMDAVEMAGDSYKIVSNETEMNDAVHHQYVAIIDDGDILARCEKADVVIEASSAIGPGAQFVITALENRKHVILMNAEIDLLFGPYFAELAEANGVICTSIDGDQYGVLKHLIDDFELWGFQPVMAGNIKGFLDRYANPTKIIAEADKRRLDYKMCTSYTDGTKLNIEMAIIANAFGMRTIKPGMTGPCADRVTEVFDLFDFEKNWSDKIPFVDYIVGAQPGGGVFAIGYHDHPYQRAMMEYYKMGKGPFYLFYRPYHLCHVEAIASIVEPVMDRKVLLQPSFGFATDVYTYAKKALLKGDLLDGLGGYTCYGMVENCEGGGTKKRLPILLADNVRLKRNIRKDEAINFDDIEYDTSEIQFRIANLAHTASENLRTKYDKKQSRQARPRNAPLLES